MSLGSVGKAEPSQFSGARKLLLIPFVGRIVDDEKMKELVGRYWAEVNEQVAKLEAGLGFIAHLYHEGAVEGGEAAAAMLKQSNPEGQLFLEGCSEKNIAFELTEQFDTLLEVMDLQRCMMTGFATQKVADQISNWYKDAQQRRYEMIAENIDQTLHENEVGILIISQDHQIQFPSDIQIFYVAPPVLNDIHKFIRDIQSASKNPPETPPPDEEGQK